MNEPRDPVRVFATDLDDTLLGDAAAEQRFRTTWDALAAGQRPLLIYNTGRSVADVQWLVLERRIPAPEFIIGGIGTEIFDPIDGLVATDFERELAAGWDRDAILQLVSAIPDARLQPPEYLNPHKLSWHWHRATAADLFRLEYRLREAGLDVIVHYTSGVYLDVLPRRAGKGNALAWLCRRIGVGFEHVVVAGTSGNNRSMFALPRARGIITANASRELLARSETGECFITLESGAAGILAGLEHFGVVQPNEAHAHARALGATR